MPDGHGKANSSNTLLAELVREATPRRLFSAFPAALVIALSAIVSGIGVAALVFTGPLQPFLFSGIGAVLLGGAVMLATLACTSSYPGSICLPQEVPAVILGILGTTLFSFLVPGMKPEQALLVVMAAIAVATMITGLAFLMLGVLRLGGIIRFIPYPLVGGVLASLGWLLMQGGVTVLVGAPLTLAGLETLVTVNDMLRLGSGLFVAVVLLLATHRSSHFAVIPSVLVASILVFYLVVPIFGSSPAAVLEEGWLLGPFPESAGWTPPNWAALTHLEWAMVRETLPIIGALVLASTVSILLYASGLELGVRCDMDLDQELRGCGGANLLAGFGGGVPGFHSMGDSLLGHAMGAPYRLTGLLAAVMVVTGLFAGFEVLAWFPRPVLSGLLFFLGLSLLLTWVVQGYRRLPLGDWLVIALILVVAGWFGLLTGIAVGLVAGIILFTLNYSRIPVTRHELSAAELHSNVDRAAKDRTFLDARGRSVHIVVLQGFIFFGTANNVLERVLARLAESPALEFLVLDFARVSGLDTSSVTTFRKLDQLAEARGFRMIFTGLATADLEMLNASELDMTGNKNIRVESDLDHGLEGCEEALLAAEGRACKSADFPEDLPSMFSSQRLRGYAEAHTFVPGEHLIRQGDPSDDIYIILEGRVSICQEGEPAGHRRLRSYGSGTLVGEMAFYTGARRSASVVADTPTRCIRLSRTTMERMTEEDPAMAAKLHQSIAALLSERLARREKLHQQLS